MRTRWYHFRTCPACRIRAAYGDVLFRQGGHDVCRTCGARLRPSVFTLTVGATLAVVVFFISAAALARLMAFAVSPLADFTQLPRSLQLGLSLLALTAALVLSIAVLRFTETYRLKAPGRPRCLRCGYDLRGSIDAGHDQCPECGERFDPEGFST